MKTFSEYQQDRSTKYKSEREREKERERQKKKGVTLQPMFSQARRMNPEPTFLKDKLINEDR